MPQMRTPEGAIVDVPDDEARHAYSRGYKDVAPDEAAAALGEREKSGGGVMGAINAGVESAASGATLGLSDVAASQLFSKGDIRQSREAREAHPYISAGGQIAGGLATGFAGEDSLLGGMPSGYLSRMAGEGIESARALGGAKAALGVAAVSGLEGAAQSGGMYLSDVALGDRDLTAEGIAGALGSGFAFGSVAGGATYGLERGTIAARRMFARTAEGGEQAGVDAAGAFDRKTDEVLQAHNDTADVARKRLDEIQKMKAEAMQQRLYADSELANARAAAGPEPDLGDIRAQAAQGVADSKVAIANAKAKAEELKTASIEKSMAEKQAQKSSKPALDFLRQFETPADEGAAIQLEQKAGPAGDTLESQTSSFKPEDSTTRLERQLGEMKSRVDAGATIQDLNAARAARGSVVNTEALLGPEVAAEEQKLTAALTDYQAKRQRVDEWIDRVKNPRKSIETNATEFGAGHSNLPRARRSSALAEDVFVEQSGGQLRTIGKGEHALADITPNSRILARSNGESFSRGAVLDDAYNDAVERARLAESPTDQDAALHEAADIEKQIHSYVRQHKPENGAVIDQIEKVRTEAGRTGYHAAFTRAERKAMDEAEATGMEWSKQDRIRPRPQSTVVDAHEASQVLGGYEKSAADLVEAVGDAAPPAAKDAATGYREAESTVDRKHLDRTTRAIDDHAADQYGPQYKSPKDRIADAKQQKLDAEAQLAQLRAKEGELRGALPKDAPKLQRGSVLTKEVRSPPAAPGRFERTKGVVEKIGTGLELASMAGIPGVPAPHDIPIVGPLLGAYLKFKAFTGKLTGRVPATAEARAAALAARTRDKAAHAVDRMLGLAEKMAPAARTVAVRTGGTVAEVLSKRLFDDGLPDAPKDASAQQLAAVRAREVIAAAQNPQAVIAKVRAQMRDVTDPDLIAAAEKQQVAMYSYLADKAPKGPPPNPMLGPEWKPSSSDAQRFACRISVANDPLVAFHQVERQQITPEAAETLRAVYPKLFQQVQQRLLERVAEVKEAISYPQRVRMSLLYDVPLDRSLEPATIASLQAAHAVKSPAAQTQQSSPPMPSMAGAPNLTALYQTAADRRAARR